MGVPRPGDVVAGKYRVDRVLGEGGMGVVLAATHEQLDQRVALKFLLPSVAANPEFVQRFLREARAAVKIQSEHVARVLDVGAHEGAPYMVMEFLEGEDIAAILASRGPLPIDVAVEFLLEACEAIAEAHALGIIHRDLKPANLFASRTRGGKASIKVLDFGISKAPAAANDPNITKTAAIMGSPNYMSPEQMVSSTSVDVRSDVWSLGVVLYEVLACRPPFFADTMPALVAAILSRPPDPIHVHRSDVPVPVQEVVQRCLQKDPAQRYSNVSELAHALLPFGPPRCAQSVERIDHVLRGSASALQQAPPGAPTGTSTAGFTFAPMMSQNAPAHRGHLRVTLLLATVAVVATSAAVVLVFRSRSIGGPGAAPVAAQASAPPTASALAHVPAATTTSTLPTASLVATAPPDEPSAADSVPGRAPPATTLRTAPHVAPSVHPPASAAAPVPTCHVVSYFDPEGNKHFKQECP